MAKFKNKISYVLALIAPIFSNILIAQDSEDPKSAGEDASKEASGSLSAGAIAQAIVCCRCCNSSCIRL